MKEVIDIMILGKVFRLFDTNNDGEIEKNELVDVVRKYVAAITIPSLPCSLVVIYIYRWYRIIIQENVYIYYL